MLVDTHAHLNFNAYKNDADEVIRRSLDEGVRMINVGSNFETSKRAVEIANKYDKGIYAAVGLHPIHLETGLVKIKNDKEEIEVKTKEENFDYEKYRELARNKKVVAIGEAGLDYWYKPKTKIKLQLFKEKQRLGLCQQLDLAKELNLPVILHCRMAHSDLIEILSEKRKVKSEKLKGVIHCFSGTWEEAKKYLEMGFYLGFNGIIFKEIEGINFEEIIKRTSLDKILIETDCPYLTPPQMGEKRNEPLFVKYIAQGIAKIKEMDFEEIAKATTQNAKELFKLGLT